MKLKNIVEIVFHGWRNVFRNKLVSTSVFILAAVLLTAVFVGWQSYSNYETSREIHQNSVADKWTNQPNRHPHRVAHYGYIVFREKSDLSFFDSGVESFSGNSVFLEAHKQNSTNFSEARHSSGLLRFGELTPALILQLLVPLLIFFLGFSAITGEREDGTLAILLAQNVSWRELLIGKTLGIISIVFALLLPITVIGLMFWLVLSGDHLEGDRFARIGVLFLTYGGFFAICAAVSVIVSALSKSSRSSLLTLIAIWILFFVVMPRAVQNLGASIYETPSQAEFEKGIEEDVSKEGDSHNANDPKFDEVRKQVLKEYKVDDVKDLPFNYRGFISLKAEEISSRIFREHFGDVLKQFRRQNTLSEIAGLLNPYMAVRQLSMTASGSDFANYESFQWQAEEYRFEIIQKLNKLYVEEIKAENDRDQKLDQEVWSKFPKYEYRPISFGESIRNQGFSVVACFLWLGIVFLILGFIKPSSIQK